MSRGITRRGMTTPVWDTSGTVQGIRGWVVMVRDTWVTVPIRTSGTEGSIKRKIVDG